MSQPSTSLSTSDASMTDHEAILGALIATYRELNLKVRPLAESRLTAVTAGTSVKSEVANLRMQELDFAQALKVHLSGVPAAQDSGDREPIIGGEAEEATTAILISQFGSARETTLSLLRGLSPEDWNQPYTDNRTLLAHAQDLVTRDKRHLEQISSLLKQ